MTIKNRTVFDYEGREFRLLDKNLEQICRLKKLTDKWEICITDYQSTDVNLEEYLPKLLRDRIPYKYLRMNSGKFSRGEGLNYAAALASGQILFFLDVDMYFTDRTVIEKAINLANSGYVYFPICSSFTTAEHTHYQARPSGKGNVALHRKMFLRNRWTHNRQWGKEDDIFFNFFRKIAVRDYTRRFFHLWHPNDEEFKNRGYV